MSSAANLRGNSGVENSRGPIGPIRPITQDSAVSIKLQKYLATAGVGSRRFCEQMIGAGRVSVNGAVARIGQRIQPGVDRIALDGEDVAPPQARIVIMVNKPAGVLSATRRGREQGTLVTELVNAGTRLFPIGRLDRDSEGLMLLTNDGDLALRLSHPRYEKEKEYEVELDRPFVMAQAKRLTRGIKLEGDLMRAVRLLPLRSKERGCVKSPRSDGGTGQPDSSTFRIPHSAIRIVLTEGHKRQIRRMLASLGYTVTRLRRTRIAGLELGDLKPGASRQLTPAEIETRLVAPAPSGRRATSVP